MQLGSGRRGRRNELVQLSGVTRCGGCRRSGFQACIQIRPDWGCTNGRCVTWRLLTERASRLVLGYPGRSGETEVDIDSAPGDCLSRLDGVRFGSGESVACWARCIFWGFFVDVLSQGKAAPAAVVGGLCRRGDSNGLCARPVTKLGNFRSQGRLAVGQLLLAARASLLIECAGTAGLVAGCTSSGSNYKPRGYPDPINNLDLAGTACTKKHHNKKDCRAKQNRGERGVRRVINHLRTRLREARESASASSVCIQPAGGCFSLPWEKQAKEAISVATGVLQKINEYQSCDKASGLAGTTSAYYGLRAEKGAAAVSAAATKLSTRFALIAGALAVANAFGIC
jgi:hypothetical protein